MCVVLADSSSFAYAWQLAPIGTSKILDRNAAQTTQLFPCRRCVRGGGPSKDWGFCQCNEFLVAPAAQLTGVAITNDARHRRPPRGDLHYSSHVHEPCHLQANIRVAMRAVWRALCLASLHGCMQHVSGAYAVCCMSHAVRVHNGDLRDMAAVAALHASLRSLLHAVHASRFHRKRLAPQFRPPAASIAARRNTDSFIMPKTVYGSDGVDVVRPALYARNRRPPYRLPTTARMHASAHTKLLLYQLGCAADEQQGVPRRTPCPSCWRPCAQCERAQGGDRGDRRRLRC